MEKENILLKIRRMAEADGGKAPGKERFYRQSGLRESDWTRHWIRWSDVIREAGLRPNKMQTAIDDEYIVSKYVGFVQELGHIPVTNELRMKSRNTKGFPNEKTLGKFGGRTGLVQKAQQYCQSRPEYTDVLLILQAFFTKEAEEIVPVPNLGGFVYLLKFGQHYKIGSTKNLARRFREIKTQMPEDGEIVHQIETGDPEGIEAYWHKYFGGKRLKGEWFFLTKEDVAYFKKRKLM